MFIRGMKHEDFAASLGMLAYSSCTVATPACLVMIWQDLAINYAQGGLMEGVRTLLMLAILILSGFAAARFGKTLVLGAGGVLMGGGMLAYALAPTYGVVLLAMGAAGLGGGALEALLNPYVHEAHPGDSGRYLNVVNAFWSVGVLGASVAVGYLLSSGVSWRWVMAGLGVFSGAVGAAFLALALRRPHRQAEGAVETFGHLHGILRRRGFWLLGGAMFFGGGVEGAFTFWTSAYLQVRHGAGVDLGAWGIAAFAAGMMLGRLASGRFAGQRHLPRLILLSCAAGFLVSLRVPWVSGLGELYVMLFAAGLTVACFWPSIQSFAADVLPVDPSMLFILLSCLGIPGFATAVTFMGLIGDRFGLSAAFGLIPAGFVGVAACIWASSRLPRAGRPCEEPR